MIQLDLSRVAWLTKLGKWSICEIGFLQMLDCQGGRAPMSWWSFLGKFGKNPFKLDLNVIEEMTKPFEVA